MKKLLFTLSIFPLFAFAQSKNVETAIFETVCLERSDIDNSLQNFEEIPFMRGFSTRGNGDARMNNSIVFFMNIKTKTWSIVERLDNLYCVIAMGEKLEPYNSK